MGRSVRTYSRCSVVFGKSSCRTCNEDKKTGQDEFGVILLDEEPQWVWMRTDEAGNNIVLRLNQEDGYTINVTQGDTEIIDYELGDGDNVIFIYQNQ